MVLSEVVLGAFSVQGSSKPHQTWKSMNSINSPELTLYL